jgi:hypothetical protein
MKNLLFIFVILFCNISFSQNIAINEVVASNNSIISDEDNDYEDFIELYNYDSVAINLENFGLSDDANDLFQWVFPNVTIQANEYLLIWASKKDRNNPVNQLHTNFKISSAGEPVILTHKNGGILSQSPVISLLSNTSLARLPNGTGNFEIVNNPTPNGVNVLSNENLEPPIFSQESGFFSSPIFLNITHPDPDVTILYSIDGSTPKLDNLNGVNYVYKNSYSQNPNQTSGELITKSFETQLYTAPLTICDRSLEDNKLANISTTYHHLPHYLPSKKLNKGTVVKAISTKNGIFSDIVTHTYFISDENAFVSNLPIISLSINEDDLFDYYKGIYVAGVDHDLWRENNPTLISSGKSLANYSRRGITTEKEAVFQYFDNQNLVVDQKIGLRLHGGFSRFWRLKSFRLYARSNYDENDTFNYTFFGNTKSNNFKRLVLRNSGNDFYLTTFRDAFISGLVEHLNFPVLDYQPTVTYLNGEYYGILNLRERFDRHYIKQKYNIEEENLDLLGIGVDSYSPEIIEGDDASYNDLYQFFENNDLSFSNNFNYIKNKIDIDNFIDYHIAHIFIRNTDWPHNNNKFFRKKTNSLEKDAEYGQDGRWRWLFFDSDFGFGFAGGENAYQHNTLAYAISHDNPDRTWSSLFLNKLIRNSEFKVDFINRYADLLNTAFLPDRVVSLIDQMKDVISNEIPNQQTRWAVPANWDSNVGVMINFANQRPSYVRQHIQEQFNISESINVNVNISQIEHGYVKINTIDLKESTVGVSVKPYPWFGVYFHNIPITLTAKSKPGYQFSHWSGASESTAETIIIKPTEDFSITANYVPITDLSEQLVYFWLFDSELENDTPFTSLSSTYSVQETNGFINFESAMVGYPLDRSHANWRKSSMERKSEATDLNYYANANNNITFEDASMKGLQIKQPFNVAGKENIMNFQFSTVNYENIKVSLAVLDDEGAVNTLIVEYLDESSQWVSTGLATPTHSITPMYELVELDFSNLEIAKDNPNFQYRIRFSGIDMTLDDGNKVIFNNIAIKGTPIEGTITDIEEGSLTPEFNQVAAICEGETTSPLPTVSENGISGSWSPVIDNTQTTTYTFTPDSELASETTMVISVYAIGEVVNPIFTPIIPIKKGERLSLPTVSENGISGSWFPAIDNTQTTTYTFTPNESQCMASATTTITVEVIVPTNFYVSTNSIVTISPTAYMYIKGGVEVATGGKIIIESNTTHSASFLAPTSTKNVTGELTYKRYVTTNWHLASPSFVGQTIGNFVGDATNLINGPSPDGNYAVAYYNNGWIYHNLNPDADNEEDLTNTLFVVGKGYSMNRTAVGNYTFTGAMATDDVIFLLTETAASVWTEVGNPYPSFLPTTSVFTANTSILEENHNALYLWNGSEYIPYNASSINEQLHPGQAFMVKSANIDAGNNFVFNESLQEVQNETTDVFQKASTVPSIIVNLTSGNTSSKTELRYFSNTSFGLDIGWDAGTFRNSSVALSIDTHLVNDSEGLDFMLQCLPLDAYETAVVPLSVKANVGEEISFSAVARNLPQDIDVYLEDKINNTIKKINDAAYTITLANAINGIGNFYLHTSSNTLNTDNVIVNAQDTINLYKTSNSNLRITSSLEEKNVILKMYSIEGKEVFTHCFALHNVNDISLPYLSAGVYLVKMISERCIYTKKIILFY